ncbi:MAG: bifunctional adenosylcobinamide kinase/adenosylcobinamide-phosphate guanylyltransferase [Anaerolineae bacterium]|nr:bifunctional adenosylcobinamide kinase/adenosylcobinamide-phosphate guanylyltransferase [Anaerolineales bacterium]MCQ3975298.1 bifunctional adenosylcobinamide kinase/adenosylcobinamide-phosphate guanylyltransferase [Anaerolineae bacterium]
MKHNALTLILGGARSGKSDYAEKLAAQMGRRVLYIATAEIGDDEMAQRIVAHRLARPADWQTLEAPRRVGAALAEIEIPPEALLLDCLTLLVSNILLALENEPQPTIETAVQAELDAILTAQVRLDAPLIVVSNEVGLGLVPPYPLGRVYRDVLGRANQYLAARAQRVIFMVAGLPMVIKDEG